MSKEGTPGTTDESTVLDSSTVGSTVDQGNVDGIGTGATTDSADFEGKEIPEAWQGRTIMEAYDKLHGTSIAAKYKTDADFLQAARHREIQLSERSDLAEKGKWLEENHEAIAEGLRLRKLQQQAPPPTNAGDEPLTWDQYKSYAFQYKQDGVWNLPANFPPNLHKQLLSADEQMARGTFDFNVNRDQAMIEAIQKSGIADKIKQDLFEELQRMGNRQTVQQQLDAIIDENIHWMFLNGDIDAPTEAGRRVINAWNDTNPKSPVRQRFQNALRIAGISRPAEGKAGTPPEKAVFKPAVGKNAGAKEPSLQETIEASVKQGDSIQETFEALRKQFPSGEHGR